MPFGAASVLSLGYVVLVCSASRDVTVHRGSRNVLNVRGLGNERYHRRA